MPWRNTIRQLARDLKSQKLRTFLTTFGIVWGTVAVSLLLAFGEGFHHQLRKTSAGLGKGIVICWPSLTSIPFEGLGKGRRIRLDETDIDLIRSKALGVDSISNEYADNLRLQLGPRTLSVDVSGVRPAFGEMRNMIPAAGGRFLNPIDEEQKRRVAFLGDELAQTLFGGADAVGQQIRVHGSPFTVVGVLQPKTQDSSYSGRDKDKVIVPGSTFRALTGQKYLDNFIFMARDLSRTEQTTAEVLSIIAGKHRFDQTDKEALSVWDTSEGFRFLDTFMFAFKLFLGVVGSLTLVVGGIGVSNIMNVVVEERTREIGIKMALGATPGAVLRQFMAETVVMTAAGGTLGLSLTHAICSAFPAFGLTEYVGTPTVSLTVGGATAALLGAIGLVAGYFPARSAARLDPVVAMKT
ncbi:MAG TPA: ABC transporter permease [Candidatus Polarisedimenticolaceae bacterium]|nr:ABC transporter permease [Candidatus Polarisedimenticolaceae bacterium]